MKKRYVFWGLSILLTALMIYIALTHPNERIANLASDYSPWAIGFNVIYTSGLAVLK